MLKNRWACFLFAALCATGLAVRPAAGHDKSWPARRLAEAMPEGEQFTSKQFTLGEDQVAAIRRAMDAAYAGEDLDERNLWTVEDRAPTFFHGYARGDDGRKHYTASMMAVDAYGDRGRMEISVVLDKQTGAVVRVRLWQHNETAAVEDPGFLALFAGMTSEDPIRVGDDLPEIPSGPAASRAVAAAVKRALLIAHAAYPPRNPAPPKHLAWRRALFPGAHAFRTVTRKLSDAEAGAVDRALAGEFAGRLGAGLELLPVADRKPAFHLALETPGDEGARKLGVALSTYTVLDGEPWRVQVAMGPRGRLLRVELERNRSTEWSAFLDGFAGRGRDDTLLPGENLPVPAGLDPEDATAVAVAVRRSVLLVFTAFGKDKT